MNKGTDVPLSTNAKAEHELVSERIVKMKWVIGITGGIGAGKSEVLALLQKELSATVILADEVAHEVMEPGQTAYKELLQTFGRDFLQPDGSIDRRAFAALLFQTEGMREKVNAIVHPLVKQEIQRRVQASDTQWVFVEAALLIEERYREDTCEELWYVHAPRELRMQRLMQNRGYSREKCESIMNSQLPDAVFCKECDRILENAGGPKELLANIRHLVEQFVLEKSKEGGVSH